MPQRSLFTDTTPLEILFAFPESELEIACGTHYTFDEYNLSIILQRRGAHNKLGFAIQLSYLRYGVDPTVLSPAAIWNNH